MKEYYREDSPGFSFRSPQECERPYTVTEINDGVASMLESGTSAVWFSGEISNFKQHTSGHCYLKIKDSQSQVPAVIWNSTAAKLTFVPQDGAAVTGIAAIRVYRKGGYYQLDIRRIQPAGLGELYAAFEALKARLAAEGLFDESRKRQLPRAVARVGVVTAKTGAAIRDIVRVIATRSPRTDIIFCNVRVQGEGAAQEIARAIERLNTHAQADVMIVGRGGGSIEDLWAFNEERVARAIAASRIPVISAVGHETDFTIADFVADVRAPTPSAAAEMAVADELESRRYYESVLQHFGASFCHHFRESRDRLSYAMRSPAMRTAPTRVAEGRQALDSSRESLVRSVALAVRDRRSALLAGAGRLEALSPLAVLERGYSVVTTVQGATVRDSAQLTPSQQVSLRFARGRAEAIIERTISAADGAARE